ncbi:hypothetical protein PWG71_16445 [Nocardiopsis sp. N85]|uniref:hypothetical protein n=1 Tax=Nocardiopsis sp. N85 TaxID=3029400 RepID=UPI00237FBC7A|nr:hypothetical protein [Nocardiopsis sp. N85]MDE3722980.1 hypothetical protein [Nocardiopsis sp. N85]
MRTAVKLAITGLFAAGLLGAGAGAANAAPTPLLGGSDAYQACVNQQNTLGLINLDLDLLTQCIANHNG